MKDKNVEFLKITKDELERKGSIPVFTIEVLLGTKEVKVETGIQDGSIELLKGIVDVEEIAKNAALAVGREVQVLPDHINSNRKLFEYNLMRIANKIMNNMKKKHKKEEED